MAGAGRTGLDPEWLAERSLDARLDLDLRVPAQLDVWPGHFPRYFVVPGVLQLDWAIRIAASRLGAGALRGVENLKFKAPLLPQQSFTLSLEMKRGGREVEFRLADGGSVFTTGHLDLEGSEQESSRARSMACAPPSSGSTSMTSGSLLQRGDTADSAALRRLIPHQGAMLLLSSVLRHDAEETTCGVEIADQQLFREADGSVPAWIGLEYMAQCIAVHGALSGEREGPPLLGFLVSARGLRFQGSRFEPLQRLESIARQISVGSSGLASFACSLCDRSTGALLAEGRIGCFAPPGGMPGGLA